jgi:alcohol dehydrogenase YqhD (iron-dependent ADH family)
VDRLHRAQQDIGDGRTHGDWASHDIAHELSGVYDMATGFSGDHHAGLDKICV